MTVKTVLSHVDHTLLDPAATWDQIRLLCDDALRYQTASVCIPPSFVRQAKEYLKDRMAVCTVIGFPNGYHTTKCKVFETHQAVADGADEIDMVIHQGWVKEQNYEKILEEIRQIRSACQGKILKVIVETCRLTRDEMIRMCQIVGEGGADYIKTSTGFASGGATFDDVALFREFVKPPLKIKAAGGISSFDDAKRFLELGADRLGTSRIVKLVKEAEKGESK